MLDDNQKIGVAFCCLGLCLGGVGIFLFLDRALLTLGNVAFLFGLVLLLGVRKTLAFFFLRPEKRRASLTFIIGVVLIALGYSLFGLPLQLYGLFQLFSSFLPQVLSAARLSPIGSWILQLPGIKQCTKWLLDRDKSRLPY
ncbi:Got1 family protein [Toxoplasma gondii TgCatPRC2]|uniref:Got1 family protein n=15 Tax=Toxoplasma gondii TaxID=5811 RepID=A0A0F7UNV6_TOXGV|nr:Got1 family protein [Toxoplasma gondii ME49]EPR57780.1 Got1 family protein [Toxoplasma gondii GT1]ESS29121.1 Got1 family protein [Toxoplasma gondii VEG]KAF4646268.1 Got1 family protein [Toxoplasma gondii]KFG28365.1 Got1 family protein [Toxoplasma gondii p89]KFG35757.1 Got1 family protein [Toxoplasma gondii FOU]KFG37097.1 Got1 family protein [Toxoplasma gondii GAB2-2007-GAL-DOM2]KFG57480.1 Got1 family protein [Toxoplasma gondii RUB]KFH00364.1 Got1 family protein [Toxoplasma gondii VAND]K|eukprot:XP_002371495.1 Got1 family protein [Toxoplasma gondii ME49]